MEAKVILETQAGMWITVIEKPVAICDALRFYFKTGAIIKCVSLDGLVLWSGLCTEKRLSLRELQEFFL